jgi:Secretion system C-terminal sorting domain
MQQEKVKWIIIILFTFAVNGLQAQNTFNVYDKSKNKTSFTLSQIQKLTFSGGNMTVNKRDATSSTYSLINLGYLNFSLISTDLYENEIDSKLLVYPNPVKDVLSVNYSNSSNKFTQKLEIIGIDGKVALCTILNNENVNIPVMFLSKGIYFCRLFVGNSVITTKFIKQ